MKINDIYELTIIDDNHLGNGIAKIENKTVFVPQIIKGDIVKVQIEKISKNIAHAKVIDLIKKSNNHQKVLCPYYNECGGCDLLHISYEREKELKEKYIKKLFKNYNKNIISLDRTNYRNKVTFHVTHEHLGFYKKETNELIEVKNCLLLEKEINDIIPVLNQIDLTNVTEITIKKGTKDILLDIKGKITKDDLNTLINSKQISSIYQNNKLLYGNKYIKLKLGNIIYSNNNNSFFQVNTKCAKELYDRIKNSVEKCESLLDLYCGTGSIGIYISSEAERITGIEINKDSTICAKENIKENNIKNYEIINSDASNIKKAYDIVIVDPPRSGLSKEVIRILNESKTKQIIYISCNPSTLKRDTELLTNYTITDMDIFNMFPGTKHVETIMILERK